MLADFLMGCEDYLGAMQCALISLSGGHKDSALALCKVTTSTGAADRTAIIDIINNSSLTKVASTYKHLLHG